MKRSINNSEFLQSMTNGNFNVALNRHNCRCEDRHRLESLRVTEYGVSRWALADKHQG
jgi:hypothetical protein